MLVVRGAGSQIAKAIVPLLPAGEHVYVSHRHVRVPTTAERYLFCDGLLIGKRLEDQTDDETAETMFANYYGVRDQCDRVIAQNDDARIAVIGSESAFAGSYDEAYAEAKRALHTYVETKQLRTPQQQLVCVAPSIIQDCAMTTRRTDVDNLECRRREHPKRRFLQASEVAKLVHFLLYVDKGYLSGVVLRMNGGAHTQRIQREALAA